MLLAGAVLLAVLLAGKSSRAMLASARLSCYRLRHRFAAHYYRSSSVVVLSVCPVVTMRATALSPPYATAISELTDKATLISRTKCRDVSL